MLSFDILLFNTKFAESKIPGFKATDFKKIQKKIFEGTMTELFEKKRENRTQPRTPK